MNASILGLLVAILIIAAGHFFFHIPEGWGRGILFLGAALVWAGFTFGPGLWRKLFGSSNLNNR